MFGFLVGAVINRPCGEMLRTRRRADDIRPCRKGEYGIERTQFTFYDSFFKAISRIRKKSERCDAYDALCRFALQGEEPELDFMPNTVAIVLEMVRPTLEAARRKAEGGLLTHSNGKSANRKAKASESDAAGCQNIPQLAAPNSSASCEEESSKNKDKDKNKTKNKDNSLGAEAFAQFWEAYPRKEGRQKALEAFEKVTVNPDILLSAIEQQKRSDQWTREGGRFIPNPANWLNGRRWEDRPGPCAAIPKGASGQLGEAELEAIQAMMARKQAREGG